MVEVIDLKLEIWFDKGNVLKNVIIKSDPLSALEANVSQLCPRSHTRLRVEHCLNPLGFSSYIMLSLSV